LFISFTEESDKKPFKILEKISSMDLADRFGIHIILKCLNSLGVTALRPPPGGAQAVMNWVSTTLVKKSFFVS